MWLKLSCCISSSSVLSPQNRNTSMFIKIFPLRILFSSLFSIFEMWWNTVSRNSQAQTREGVFHLLSHPKKHLWNALWKIRFLNSVFFWQQENHFHDECRNRMSLETGRLDAKSFRYELKLFNCTKIPFISSIVSAWTEKNILGEYSSFFKLRTWNYLHLDRINLYRNDL